MNEIVIVLIALLATLSVVTALVAVAVYAMSRKSNRSESPAVRRQHVNPVDMSWRYVSVNVEGPCRDIDSDSWRDQLWFDALVERKFGAADGELTAEVFETDHRGWNLAHVYDPNDCRPGFSVFLPEGKTLEKVGAREFRLVVRPVPAKVDDGEDGGDAGGKGGDGGDAGEGK